jgi:hypothetical protein
MKNNQQSLSPLDVVILLKIIALGKTPWLQNELAKSLHISQSEVSKSLMRSKYARLIDMSGKKVSRLALMELIQFGIKYIFPQQPGAIVRGIATAHSASPLNTIIISEEPYVWPTAKGNIRGQSILPLYPSIVDAVLVDNNLYEMLALIDALRVGKVREREIAIKELNIRIINNSNDEFN